MRDVISYILLAGLSGGLIYLFSMMWIDGTVRAAEPDSWIRGIELGSCIATFCFSIFGFITRIKRLGG